MFDGFELTIEIKKHPTANRGLSIYSGEADGNVSGNINTNETTTISFNTSTLVLDKYSYLGFYPTFNNTHSNIYTDKGQYDINEVFGAAFKILLRWNARTSQWDEVSRSKFLS